MKRAYDIRSKPTWESLRLELLEMNEARQRCTVEIKNNVVTVNFVDKDS